MLCDVKRELSLFIFCVKSRQGVFAVLHVVDYLKNRLSPLNIMIVIFRAFLYASVNMRCNRSVKRLNFGLNVLQTNALNFYFIIGINLRFNSNNRKLKNRQNKKIGKTKRHNIYRAVSSL